ncbi:Retrovirus-related Pol polyprotein from transposon 17.6 [Collichthys lucidus]|uniref:ribonuclease H n=1 Tax=Collichthys lucidus TaxID=240159 RepID=A0A4U5TUN4_COLLU|nr:Retrovirus-related Pol polyprotein from transposon 17.6 [Collichthys lucidus]
MAGNTAALPPFDTETDPSSVGPRWNKWVQRFENYTTAMNITGDARLKALLLHIAGERVYDIYDTLAAEGDKYADTKQKLSGYFSPKKNIQYQVYIFRKATQEPGENLDGYHTRLRMLAKNFDADKISELPQTHIKLNSSSMLVLIDSGASANCVSETSFEKLVPRPNLSPTKTKIYPFRSNVPLPVSGAFKCSVEKGQKKTMCTFFVIKGDGFNVLSYKTSKALGLIKVVTAVSSTLQCCTVADELVESHPELFQGIGKLKDFQVKLHINPDIKPTCQPHRRVPFHIRQKVEDELRKLEADDIIEEVSGPTPWISPIVAPPKPKDPDKVRICVDMRQANTAIERERHITPTMDDVIHELNGATVFSKLDLRAGYHQLELHPDSRYITTFTTHLGLRRYKRLSFGISSAAEVFQNAICQTLQGLSGVKNLSDDIIVYGASQTEHDNNLQALFQRLSESGLTLNRAKCEFNKSRLEFFGFIFSAQGVSADPKKVAAVQHAADPQNPGEIKSLLGMANYCSRFIKDFSSISEPLRKLTRKDTPWAWGPEQQAAVQTLKDSLTSDTTMSYFYPGRETELIVDASPVGLGAILCQKDEKGVKYMVAYASRSLSDVERRYSQTEKEALAIVWSCEHFHLYIYGHPFILVTDHKALEIIWNNPRSKPLARIERWGLRLQPYNFKVEYRKGADNPADYMSRHPIGSQAEAPWHSVSADFYGPLPTGEYLLVIIDDYTRYPVVESVRSTSASTVIPVMDKIFSMFGIPRVVKTDNGPPFNSDQFSQFADYLGFHHRRITPLWPQANATAERFMRTLGKAVRVAETQGVPWKQQLNIFLREYRSTPHSLTESSPAELLFQVYTKIPAFTHTANNSSDSEVRARDNKAKAKMKSHADSHRHATPHILKPGDTVLHRQPKHNKLTTPYNSKPYTVTKVKGSMVTAARNGHFIVRNSSFFKKITPELLDILPDPVDDDCGNSDAITTTRRYPSRHNRRPPVYLRDYT